MAKHSCVIRNRLVPIDDFSMTTAIPTHGGAKGHVEIERASVAFGYGGKPVAVGVIGHVSLPMRYRRIAGIAWHRPVIPF